MGKEKKKKKTKKIPGNVFKFETLHIEPHRWGFLPMAVELFLHTDNSQSVSKQNSAIIKKNEHPLLRYGVELSTRQSFIACMADLYAYSHDGVVPSLSEMRKHIIDRLSLDIYLQIHNGSLVSTFRPTRKHIDDITVEKYKNTGFYTSITNKDDIAQYRFLIDTIASYENFIAFLEDDDAFIDHTYLWDIITSPETGIFKDGINLVILDMLDSDITDDIALVCPTNSYQDKLYEPSRGTVILLKNKEYYEPVYMYGQTPYQTSSSDKPAIKIFHNNNIPNELVRVFDMIERTTAKYCPPKQSLPRVYNFKSKPTCTTDT